jgi:hypothetical protein
MSGETQAGNAAKTADLVVFGSHSRRLVLRLAATSVPAAMSDGAPAATIPREETDHFGSCPTCRFERRPA